MKDKGAVAVEFAILAPIFFMVLFGITEFGRVWMTKNIMTQAAREGARYAAVLSDLEQDDSRVESRVNDCLAQASLKSIDSITNDAPGSGNPVTVTVTGTFEVLTGSIIPGFSGEIDLTASSTFRYEM